MNVIKFSLNVWTFVIMKQLVCPIVIEIISLVFKPVKNYLFMTSNKPNIKALQDSTKFLYKNKITTRLIFIQMMLPDITRLWNLCP